MERKPGVAGGSKWTYEATFHIAMKGGREYYTTAAPSLTLGKSKIPKHSNSWDQQNQQKTPNIDYYCHLKMIRNSLVPANANT